MFLISKISKGFLLHFKFWNTIKSRLDFVQRFDETLKTVVKYFLILIEGEGEKLHFPFEYLFAGAQQDSNTKARYVTDMAYESDTQCFGYLLVPSLDTNQLQEHYEMSTGTSPKKCIKSLRGLPVCLRLWFPPEAASMCPFWSFGCNVSLQDVVCAGRICAGTCVCVCMCVCLPGQDQTSIYTTLAFWWSLVQPFPARQQQPWSL